ncbi:unnamed protein product [Triticum turgidum subsp. durum]|uniref:Uncharacterized protein n=1 Tax=Triticum turgidum subsp. durum TaxID=4567 RepID=A0A9R1C2Q8_TRITD|nr:unnamed protein product [Triticum turgidum subsp. durum]
MEKARRRQVPAFGEWNYCHGYDEPPAERYAPEPEDCSDVWFKYSPPPRKPAPKKTRSDVAREKQGRRAKAPEGGGLARATSRAASASRVVRPVDEDLYQVPPPELASRRYRPRRVRTSGTATDLNWLSMVRSGADFLSLVG